MARFQFTLAQLMAALIYLGLGSAALRDADGLWASATFTLSILTISTALVGAFVRRGPARSAWIGFAVFGWAYFLIGVIPPRRSGGLGFGPLPWPPELIAWGMASLQPYLKPLPAAKAFMAVSLLTPYEQISHSLGVVLFGSVGAFIGRFFAMRDEPANP
jgi:hypothetical protein